MPDERTCPNCGAAIPAAVIACETCGWSENVGAVMSCPACGQTVARTAVTCPHCGQIVAAELATAPGPASSLRSEGGAMATPASRLAGFILHVERRKARDVDRDAVSLFPATDVTPEPGLILPRLWAESTRRVAL